MTNQTRPTQSSLFDFTLVVIDVETSGLCPKTHSLLEVGLVTTAWAPRQFKLFVRPDHDAGPMTWQGEASNMFAGRREQWEVDAVPYLDAYEELSDWTAQFDTPVMLVGHNVGFDISFLKQLSRGGNLPANVSHRSIDTHTLAMAVYAREGKAMPNGLTALLVDNNVAVEEGDRHTALGDAIATRKLYLRLMERLEGRATAPLRF